MQDLLTEIKENRDENRELPSRLLQGVTERSTNIRDIYSSHEEMYPNFSQLYNTAKQKIEGVIKNSPYKSRKLTVTPNSYEDLSNVRKNIIGKSAKAS